MKVSKGLNLKKELVKNVYTLWDRVDRCWFGRAWKGLFQMCVLWFNVCSLRFFLLPVQCIPIWIVGLAEPSPSRIRLESWFRDIRVCKEDCWCSEHPSLSCIPHSWWENMNFLCVVFKVESMWIYHYCRWWQIVGGFREEEEPHIYLLECDCDDWVVGCCDIAWILELETHPLGAMAGGGHFPIPTLALCWVFSVCRLQSLLLANVVCSKAVGAVDANKLIRLPKREACSPGPISFLFVEEQPSLVLPFFQDQLLSLNIKAANEKSAELGNSPGDVLGPFLQPVPPSKLDLLVSEHDAR